MNVFVLCTGRCGSKTLAEACKHADNYTVAHESNRFRAEKGGRRPYHSLKYADNHIEVDNRLSWFLGSLDEVYGDAAFYVHLKRNYNEVARSLIDRGNWSILSTFASGILQYRGAALSLSEEEWLEVAVQYWKVVNANIEFFLRDKTRRMTIWLHDLPTSFLHLWRPIEAEGDLQAAVAECSIIHNATRHSGADDDQWTSQLRDALEEVSSCVPSRSKLILVDNDQWGSDGEVNGRIAIPFLERDGQYWGPPPDDETAIRELERLRHAGADYMVFAWPAFWWLDHYTGLRAHLDRFHCLLKSDRVVVFDLTTSV